MGRDIAVAGLVLTIDEWRALDAALRAQLLASASPPRDDRAGRDADAYEAYELVPAPAV